MNSDKVKNVRKAAGDTSVDISSYPGYLVHRVIFTLVSGTPGEVMAGSTEEGDDIILETDLSFMTTEHPFCITSNAIPASSTIYFTISSGVFTADIILIDHET